MVTEHDAIKAAYLLKDTLWDLLADLPATSPRKSGLYALYHQAEAITDTLVYIENI